MNTVKKAFKEIAMSLAADSFSQDPRVQEAKKLIQSALEEHQKRLEGHRSSHPELREKYEQLLKDYTSARGGALWYPYIGSGFGKGALVELADGSVKYDLICGIGPHYWGHCHPDLIESSIDAALTDTVMQGHLQGNKDSVTLCQTATKLSGMDHCFLTTSGVMANENGLKLAFQKKHPAHRVLAFEGCFMGRTLSASQITDKPAFRQGLPANMDVSYIPFYDASCPEESTKRAVQTLKSHLNRYPGEYAVMCFELVQGEGGFYPGTRDFFMALIDVLKEHDVSVFIDEVQTFGRTPKLFAFQYFNLEEHVDIVTFGKVSQVCGTLFNEEFKPKPGLLSQTFTGSSASIRASQVIFDGLASNKFYGKGARVEQVHERITGHFKRIQSEHPGMIEGPFGIGAMIAFTPFSGRSEHVIPFTKKLFENGVITFVAGVSPMRVRMLAPVGSITDEQIDAALKIVEETLVEYAEQENGALAS